MFLIENLWAIFEMAKEERTDSDNFEGDIDISDNLFLTWVNGGGEHFNCMEGVDRKALKDQWDNEDQPAAQREYDLIMTNLGDGMSCHRFKDLCDAFHANDHKRFQEVVDDALAALRAADAKN